MDIELQGGGVGEPTSLARAISATHEAVAG